MSARPQWWRSEADDAISRASFAAACLIYEHAAKYREREDYRPLEELARAVQRAVIEGACQFLNEYGGFEDE